MIISHYEDKDTLMQQFNSDENMGLSSLQVEENRKKYGNNSLKAKKKKTFFQKYIDQFKDVMIIILLIAAVISFIVAFSEDDMAAFFEPILIVAIVVVNALMGVLQENKAEKAMEALMQLSSPHARVIRDGKQQMIDAKDLVVGDILILQDGDYVPADARLLEEFSLKVEESALTGESVPVEKDASQPVDLEAPLAERLNMVFSGCSILYGSAKAIVTQTGMNTEMGKIAKLIDNEVEMKTPLQMKLSQLGKYLGVLALVICFVIFVMGIIDGMDILEIFMTSVSLAVSAIPEGLPVIVTIVLSIGVSRMAKHKAIVKKLPAVETLGSTSIICSDKTGTLTQNKMTLVKMYTAQEKQLKDIDQAQSDADMNLLKAAVSCCDGDIEVNNGEEKPLGDPTETCLVAALMHKGITKQQVNEQYPRLFELPFDSNRKLMTTVNQIGDKRYAIVKGAYDILASRCLDDNMDVVNDTMLQMSQQALRVIAVGYKEVNDNESEYDNDYLENDLHFAGLLGMIDPPRPEAKKAVAECKKAGIKPIMITGDHVVTAGAIAKELGILNEGDMAITGVELDDMSDEEFDNKVTHISVYARVSPENKIRVVKTWQKKGYIVSMTGDGVNDAPALKASDIGCAMGITGTDVAKGAADLTLMDDNFSTIVAAVKEGRGIYNNIRKTVGFLLGTNIGEVVLVFLSMLFWKQAPLLSVQLLWVNLVTDSLPAIALGTEPIEDDVMYEKPRHKNESLFAHGLGIQVILQGFMFGCLALTAFRLGWRETGNIEVGRTMSFMVLSLSQIIHAYNMRSSKSLFKIGIFKNKNLNKAALISLLMVFIVLFVPAINDIFGLRILSLHFYISALILSFVPVLVLEIVKAFHLLK